MGYDLHAFKNYTFEEKGQDCFLADYQDYFDESKGYPGPSRWFEAKKTAQELELSDVFETAVPYIHECPTFVSAEEKANLEKILLAPAKCLELEKEHDLFSKIIAKNPNVEYFLTWIKDMWNEGYYVHVSYL